MDQQHIEADVEVYPHAEYMEAVEAELIAAGLTPKTWWIESPDGAQLDAYFRLPGTGSPTAAWPDGVELGWDQYDGWQVIADGNATPLSEDSGVYGQPRQIATDAWNRIATDQARGPICMTGERFDTAGLRAAVEAWDADAA
ncbi:hypothetical protein ACFYS8_36325 [Kitasatospora sp. NPDC004615]|uniref:hypothetical protein n=1 Tax=Kitasatospora sp. NPDC004615 TaxID=3364017 RepID=UPI0036ACA6AA